MSLQAVSRVNMSIRMVANGCAKVAHGCAASDASAVLKSNTSWCNTSSVTKRTVICRLTVISAMLDWAKGKKVNEMPMTEMMPVP